MKNSKFNYLKITVFLGLVFSMTISCDRDLSDDAELAGFSKAGDVFIDGFTGGLDYFPFADSYFEAFSVDTETKYAGSAAMRFDVPNVGDPAGAYSGAIFRLEPGRDLSGYDALTFWAKGTRSGMINEIGFGQDFAENKYLVTTSLQLTTNWRKYIIPLPDASKLTQEKGMFWYAEGPENGEGYSFWIDELQFEKLGTIAQPRPSIFDGQDLMEQAFIGSIRDITGRTQTFNLATGLDRTVVPAPSYFEFTSSNPSVAIVSELGQITVIGAGIATITATLNNIEAAGSITLESLGDFTQALVPTRDPENVISIFSDAYTNVPVDYYNGFFNGDGQTTLGGAPPININGNQIINYTALNFVGIGTFLNVAPVNATQMTHFHIDINVQDETIQPTDFIKIRILNRVQTGSETLGEVTIPAIDLLGYPPGQTLPQFPFVDPPRGWSSFDIPLADFAGLGGRDALGLIFLVSDTTISNIYVDNVYYYKEVVEPSPNVDDSGANQVALPVGFESTTLTYDVFGFEGADSAVAPNPMVGGINPTSRVVRTTKTVGAQFFAGTVLNLAAPINFSTSQKFRMKVLSPKIGIPIRIRLENAANTVGIELDASTTTMNEWEELEWDFSNLNTSASFVRIVVFFEFVPNLPGDGSTYYFDDIQIIE